MNSSRQSRQETSPGPVAALSGQPLPSQEPSARQAPAPETARRSSLTLRIVESDNPLGDQMLLDDIKRLLLDHPGEDRVMLEIATEGQLHRLEWSVLSVRSCPELSSALERMLGPSGNWTSSPG